MIALGPIATQLRAMSAPKHVLEAGQELDASNKARLSPSKELSQYVQRWLANVRSNNRYGK